MKLIIRQVTSKIEADYPSQMEELRHWFSIPVKGAHFAGARSYGGWDGRKYYVTEGGSIATGMLPMFRRWALETNTEVDVVDERILRDVVIKDTIPLEGIEYRDYQEEGIDKLLNNTLTIGGITVPFRQGIHNLGTNAGKTLIAYLLHQKVEGNTLLLISSRETYRDLVRGLSAHMEVGEINASKINIKPFTICMSKTLQNRCEDKKFLKMLNESTTKLIVDEGHEAGGKNYSKLLKKLSYPQIRLVMSGTPFDHSDQCLALNVLAAAGEELIKVTKKQLMDRGISLKAKVTIYKHCPDVGMLGKDYRQIMETGLLFSESRVQLYKDYIDQNPDKFILISVKESKSGQFIYERLQREGLEVVHASDKDRDEKVDRFRTGDTQVLISTMMIKQGVNMPLINTIIFAFGGKDKLTMNQVGGRGERLDGINKSFEIIDFYDDCDYLSDHSRARIKTYLSNEFEVNFNYEHNKKFNPI